MIQFTSKLKVLEVSVLVNPDYNFEILKIIIKTEKQNSLIYLKEM